MPAMYSSIVISFSLQKSCRWRVKLAMTLASLGLALGPVALITMSVNFGSKREVLVLLSPPLAAPLEVGPFVPESPSCSGTMFIPSRISPDMMADGVDRGTPGGTVNPARGVCLKKKKSLMERPINASVFGLVELSA